VASNGSQTAQRHRGPPTRLLFAMAIAALQEV